MDPTFIFVFIGIQEGTLSPFHFASRFLFLTSLSKLIMVVRVYEYIDDAVRIFAISTMVVLISKVTSLFL